MLMLVLSVVQTAFSSLGGENYFSMDQCLWSIQTGGLATFNYETGQTQRLYTKLENGH